VNILRKKFDEILHEQAKGNLSDIIKSMALHVMDHKGQIVLLRKMLDDPFWSFVGGVDKENRKELRTTWITWWVENKVIYQKLKKISHSKKRFYFFSM